MKTQNNSSAGFLKVEQVNNQITSWIGNGSGEMKNIAGGQTFIATTEGILESIEVFSNIVSNPGIVKMTFHQFDPLQRIWGPALCTTDVEFSQNSTGNWVVFPMEGVHLTRGASYGFKMQSVDALIGVGEAVGNHREQPFSNGQEWQFNNNIAYAFSYFSLAFKIDLKAA
jgi:hypothetical protein